MKARSSKERTKKLRTDGSHNDLKVPFRKTEALLLLMLVTVVVKVEFWLSHHPLAWQPPIHHFSASK